MMIVQAFAAICFTIRTWTVKTCSKAVQTRLSFHFPVCYNTLSGIQIPQKEFVL